MPFPVSEVEKQWMCVKCRCQTPPVLSLIPWALNLAQSQAVLGNALIGDDVAVLYGCRPSMREANAM